MKSIFNLSIFVFMLAAYCCSIGVGQEVVGPLPLAKSLALPSTLTQNADQIGLSEKQMEFIKLVCQKTNEQALEMRGQANRVSLRLAELLAVDQMDEKNILQLLDELHRVEGINKSLRLQALVQINNHLQPEQRDHALQIQSDQRSTTEIGESTFDENRNPETKSRMKSKLAEVRRKLRDRQHDSKTNTLRSRLAEFRRLMRSGQIQSAEDLLDDLLESLQPQASKVENNPENQPPLSNIEQLKHRSKAKRTLLIRSNPIAESSGCYVTMQDSCASDTANLPWVTDQSNAPGVAFHLYQSAAAGTNVSFHIFKPEAYTQNPEQRFPVLYWLHGTLGGIDGIPGVAQHFNAAIENGTIPPMLVVMVNGLPCRLWSNSKDGASPVESAFVEDLIPYVDANFRTRPSREHRLIEGFSMGGFGAGRLGIKHSNVFSRVSMLSAGPLDTEFMGPLAQANPALRQEILDIVCDGDLSCFAALTPTGTFEVHQDELLSTSIRFRQVIGELEGSLPCNEEFHQILINGKFPHDWFVVPDTDHNPLQILQYMMNTDSDFYNTLLLGDINNDGAVNLLDVAPFVEVLGSGGYLPEADLNSDGAVNLMDVGLFIQALTG